MKFINQLMVLCAMCSLLSTSLNAADIKLESADGAFALSGQLIEFDGDAYTLKTVFGAARIDANSVICTGEDCPDLTKYNKEIMLASTDAISVNLLPMLLEGFSENSGYQPQVADAMHVELLTDSGEVAAQVAIAIGDASDGFAALSNGSAMLALASRNPDKSEIVAISDAGFGDISSVEQQTVLALDALVILVSQNNPVNFLSIQQVGEISSGKIANWKELGGQDAAINVYRRNVDTGVSVFFASKVLAPIGAEFAQATSIISSNGDISESVNADPFGIGFSSYSDRGDAKSVTLKGSCGIYSAPTEFSIKTEEYPLSRRLSVYASDSTLPSIAENLVTYLGANATQQVVARAGYVNLEVLEKSVEDQGLRFASAILSATGGVGVNNLQLMMRNLIESKRLSTTFRFLDGSSTLDMRALSDVDRLVDWLAGADVADKEILLVGFTDSDGKLTVNMALAEQRAKQVLNAIIAAAPDGALDGLNFKAVGLGEVSPMACSDAPDERIVNRRVEVWISEKN